MELKSEPKVLENLNFCRCSRHRGSDDLMSMQGEDKEMETTYYFFFWLLGFSMQYLSDLIHHIPVCILSLGCISCALMKSCQYSRNCRPFLGKGRITELSDGLHSFLFCSALIDGTPTWPDVRFLNQNTLPSLLSHFPPPVFLRE